jgi:hypothetical protein
VGPRAGLDELREYNFEKQKKMKKKKSSMMMIMKVKRS